MMDRYYEVVDAAERKRIRDAAKQKFSEIANNHKKYVLARDKLQEEEKAAAAEEVKRPMIEEEKKSEAMQKLQTWEDQYASLLENRRNINLEQCDAKDQEQVRRDEEYQLFLETEHFLCAEGLARLEEN